MKSGWGWSLRPGNDSSRRGVGVEWLRPTVAAAPWITIGVLLLMMYFASGTMIASEGVLFDLPEADFTDGESTSLVALALPMQRQTLLFFDDARFVLDDAHSMDAFSAQLAEQAEKRREKTLLILADRRILTGELMNLAMRAKKSGIERILFAERHNEEGKPFEQ